jgi:Zn-finger nucleic acid-binding protein
MQADYRIARPFRKDVLMLCPICKTVDLVMSERQGVEIDYCPTRRGVWLDRGELDKIIERSNQADGSGAASIARAPAMPISGERLRHGESDHHDNHGRDDHGYDQQRRRGSFLERLFD